MSAPVKCVIFGLGRVGIEVCSQLLSKRVEIVGVYTRSRYIGQSLSEVLNQDQHTPDLRVQNYRDFSASTSNADIAIFCTTSYINNLMQEAKACLEHGINVLTIAEDALFPWHHSPRLAAELDRIAKQSGVTLSATGVNDIAMTQLPAMLAAFSRDIRQVSVECVGDFGNFGRETLEGMPLNLSAHQFNEWLEQTEPADQLGSISGQTLEAILALMALEPAGDIELFVEPTWTTEPTEVKPLGLTLDTGMSSGIREIARIQTTTDIKLEVILIGKVFGKGDTEYVDVQLDASPALSLRIEPLPGVEVTAAAVVNRIQDVIAAQPGFLSADKLPGARYSTLI